MSPQQSPPAAPAPVSGRTPPPDGVPVGIAAALLAQLAAGPVTLENSCTGCVHRDCNPERCTHARQFERLVDELQTLEERGLVRLWLHNVYSSRPNARAMIRVRLTDAGRIEYSGR